MMDLDTSRAIVSLVDVATRHLAGIPHVEVTGAAPRGTMQKASRVGGGAVRASSWRRLRGMDLQVSGWSSSLHGAPQAVPVMGLDDPVPTIEAFARTQRRRIEQAARMGRRKPFGLRDDLTCRKTEISHMLCDRKALRMMLEMSGDDPMEVANWLRQDVEAHHAGTRSGNRVRGTTIVARGLGDNHEYTAPHLLVRAPVPATIMAGACGRRVGEVVDAHPDLAPRRIVSIETTGPDGAWTRIGVTPDNVRIGNILLI
jgi:hypothetical protein